jgi:aspartate kinase
MQILVQKFGGTSVANDESRQAAAAHVEQAVEEGYHVVVVVSAMGRRGDPYATDTLLGMLGDETAVSNHRDLDILMACGEAISSVVFAGMLRARGHEVAVLTGAQAGIVTSGDYGDARIIEIQTKRILDELAHGRIVVVMGFQGATPEGELTTLGRGGSDTTATALGVALNAAYVDIFTDVEGIMTADPRIVEDARRLNQVTYAEICNLAYQGAKVIHPRAVEIAMQKNIPIRVRSTLSQDYGTLVTSSVEQMETAVLRDRFITGVAHTVGQSQLRVSGENVGRTNLFKDLAERGISVDFISISPDRVAFTVKSSDTAGAVSVVRRFGFEPAVIENCARVAAVGAGMAGMPGVMARIMDALLADGIEILQSADSHTTIWCLVNEADVVKAVRALHQMFSLATEPLPLS